MGERRQTEEEAQEQLDQEALWRVGEGEGREAYAFADRTIGLYNELGVADRPRPKVSDAYLDMFPGMRKGSYYDGRMPTVLRKLDLDQISALLSLQTNWYAYLSSQFARIAAKRSAAKKTKEFLWSQVRMTWSGFSKKVHTHYSDQKLSDLARVDKRFLEADAEYEELNTIYSALSAILEVAKKELETVSREVTIRQTEIEAEARGRGVASRFGGNAARERRRGVDATPDKIKTKTPTFKGARPKKGAIRINRK